MTKVPMRIDPDGVDRSQLEEYYAPGHLEIRELGSTPTDGAWVRCADPWEARL